MNKMKLPDNQLFHMVIRMPKEESAFTYFQLESNEGLCFYSTLKSAPGSLYRDIDIIGHKSLLPEFTTVIESLKKQVTFDIIEQEVLTDSQDINQEV